MTKLPDIGPGMWREMRDFVDHFGVVPDLTTAWNLTAWSWLFDWAVNLDSLFANVSYLGPKGVSIHYAYLMAETEVRQEYVCNYGFRDTYVAGAPFSSQSLSQSILTRTKQRVRASPFGFGITYSSLSTKQKAILAALGMSRARF
jgi:hypothetical protein